MADSSGQDKKMDCSSKISGAGLEGRPHGLSLKDVCELNLTEFDFALSLAVQIHNPLFYSLDLLYLVF